MSPSSSTIKQDEATLEMTPDEDIWYFGFGPIVHEQVRQRRGVSTTHCQAAVLRDHRLTFAFGGVATIVPQMGFMVHGVVMKVTDLEAWEKLKAFDSGYYVHEELDVFPYQRDEYDDGDLDEFFATTQPIQCFGFVMNDFDENVEMDNNKIEKKPQERYLRLIAQGMLDNGVDETYVGDEIMACPFIESRKEEEWYTFPLARTEQRMSKISFEGYQKLCKRKPNELYFIMNQNQVIKADLSGHGDGNPAVEWMKQHAHGKEDITHLIHKMIVDPIVPYAETPDLMTERHYHWAVNHIFDFLLQADVTAKVTFFLTHKSEKNKTRSISSAARMPSRLRAMLSRGSSTTSETDVKAKETDNLSSSLPTRRRSVRRMFRQHESS
uniref:gamma-glutamylcyclotransferase n=1 Tax=Entomoneis paludosa TaxID=265537 RepID=A0A7S2VG95_9STRA